QTGSPGGERFRDANRSWYQLKTEEEPFSCQVNEGPVRWLSWHLACQLARETDRLVVGIHGVRFPFHTEACTEHPRPWVPGHIGGSRGKVVEVAAHGAGRRVLFLGLGPGRRGWRW